MVKDGPKKVFYAPAIWLAMQSQWFGSHGSYGVKRPAFRKKVNGNTICLVVAYIWVYLKKYERTGFLDPALNFEVAKGQSKSAPLYGLCLPNCVRHLPHLPRSLEHDC